MKCFLKFRNFIKPNPLQSNFVVNSDNNRNATALLESSAEISSDSSNLF